MRIELITIGSELLAGITLNTNAQFIGDHLARAGLRLTRQLSIPDDHDIIVAAAHDCLSRADWVIVSGGLGPTNDDVTKKALARVFDLPLVFHDELLSELRERFTRAGRPITPLLDTQALLPRDAQIIPNPIGTAVGMILTQGAKSLAAVPGVPREMRPMISEHIVPRIAVEARTQTRSQTWSTTGWPESRLYENLEGSIGRHPEVTVAFLPSELGVKLRFVASGADARNVLDRFAAEVRPMIARATYAEEDIGLETILGRLLKERRLTVALAESCTGGLAAKRLTDVPGSSDYVIGAFVAYANSAKARFLGVEPGLLDTHGAVSEPVARAMADGARERCGSDCAVAITGIAGPAGGTPDKPVGLVWLAVAMKNRPTTTRQLRLLGNREMIRERAAQAALDFLRVRILET